ncbi:Ig-like domain-containing protein [Nocardioides caricicola]|uniref:Ig-like domain-containing protein n=1 Tax=Nocardioides caricicola TaxID=634770 RepID=A0ABW0MZ18_9ACTN
MTLRSLTAAALAAAVLAATPVAPTHADEVDPLAPVVVDDEITMWPGERTEIDVIANDSDPNGDDLALCRVPSVYGPDGEEDRPVVIYDRSWLLGPPGVLQVATDRLAEGTHVLEYYVCNHTRLTLAHLTVTIRPVQPVDVVPDRVPDRILVTNHNDQTIRFLATDRTGCKVDVRARVAAGETRSFAVRRHSLDWVAFIGQRGDLGIADSGRVRHVELTRPPAPPGPQLQICLHAWSR